MSHSETNFKASKDKFLLVQIFFALHVDIKCKFKGMKNAPGLTTSVFFETKKEKLNHG